MELLIVSLPLGEDCAYSDIRGIDLHYILSRRVWQAKDGDRGKTSFECSKGSVSGQSPTKGHFQRGVRGCHRAVSSDEATSATASGTQPYVPYYR